MIKDITIGQYFPGKSFLHNMDPRIKIVLMIAFIVDIFICKNFLSLALMVACVIGLILISKISFKVVLKSVKPLLFIIIFTALLNMFYVKGQGKPLVDVWIIKIYLEGIYTAIFMTIRIICLIMSSSLLTYTTSPTALTDAIERLLKPLTYVKLDVHSVAMMMTIALRFIPTLIEEIDKIMSAQKARGADMESGNLIQRVKAMLPILVPLFVSAFRRAYELSDAMECRCYRGGEGRTSLKVMKAGWRDLTAFLFIAALFAGTIVLNFYFGTVVT